jgi:peptidoglycan/xylan/chitin deacetylase (PgdA/CDA1 family)
MGARLTAPRPDARPPAAPRVEAVTGPPTAAVPAARVPSTRRAVRVPILMYHRITEKPDAHPYSLAVDRFRAQLGLLRRFGYRAVSPVEVAEAIRTGASLPSRSVALTFDDGYQDTFSTALPVLLEFGFSATCYLVSSRLGKHSDWTARAPLMDCAEARAWVDAGMAVGSHSRTHVDLTTLAPAELRREVDGSGAELEDRLGVPVRSFAYPFNRLGRRELEVVGGGAYRAGCAGPELHGSVFALTRVSAAWPSLGWFLLQLLPVYPELRHVYRRVVLRRDEPHAAALAADALQGG